MLIYFLTKKTITITLIKIWNIFFNFSNFCFLIKQSCFSTKTSCFKLEFSCFNIVLSCFKATKSYFKSAKSCFTKKTNLSLLDMTFICDGLLSELLDPLLLPPNSSHHPTNWWNSPVTYNQQKKKKTINKFIPSTKYSSSITCIEMLNNENLQYFQDIDKNP